MALCEERNSERKRMEGTYNYFAVSVDCIAPLLSDTHENSFKTQHKGKNRAIMKIKKNKTANS